MIRFVPEGEKRLQKLNMDGEHPFSEKEIDARVAAGAIGNYALGAVNDENNFVVMYVGRSDADLNQRLKDHIGEGYTHFAFSRAASPETAYAKECRDYHLFVDTGKRLDNKIHPDKPKNSSAALTCPVCGQ